MLQKLQKALPPILRPYAKAVAPAALVIVGVLVRAAITGHWDAAEWAASITGLVTATVVYFVPNADLDALGIHPAKVALAWLGTDQPPKEAPILPDEQEDAIHAKLEASADLAGQLGVIKPLPPGQRAPARRKATVAIAMTRATVPGRELRKAAKNVSHTAHYVRVAGQHGCRKGLALVIIAKCRLRGVPISLGFALIQHESGFSKVFGHDPTICIGWGFVTKTKYLVYRAMRRRSGNRLMQGVGEGQLTWWATQDAADSRGGCWKAEANIDTSYITLGSNIHTYGYVKGVERYNGFGPAAVEYSRQVRAAAAYWHHILTEGLPR